MILNKFNKMYNDLKSNLISEEIENNNMKLKELKDNIEFEDILEKYDYDFDEISNDISSNFTKIPEDFIDCFKDKLNWDLICLNSYSLSESFIEKYKDYVNWDIISEYQKLSEPFIEKMKDYINWDIISNNQELSESFIEKYKDKLNWNKISYYQHLSKPFIEKYKNYINLNAISES